MYALLKTTIEEPTPAAVMDGVQESILVFDPEISSSLRQKLHYMHVDSFDWEEGGLKSPIKFLDRDSVEYSLLQAANHHQTEARMARLSLTKSFALLDPVWGGVYQYSTQGNWDHPHFEKTMAAQAGYLRVYIMAYSLWHEHRFLLAAICIYNYMIRFLTSPEGAFYAGQSDKITGYDPTVFFSLTNDQRLRIGIPAINKHIYARQNGWAIEALATLYEYTSEDTVLQRALQAANWIMTHRSIPEGGFHHDDYDETGPYLGDSLAMGRAMLHLYRVTADEKWLSYACNAADFISQHFKHYSGGFNRAIDRGEVSRPAPQIDENISFTRFANLLFHYTGQLRFRGLAKHGFRYLSKPQIATARQEEAGILLTDIELRDSPVNIVIVGEKDDPGSLVLYDTALCAFGWYKKIEWFDNNKPLPVPIKNNASWCQIPAAYVMNEFYCSGPITEPEKLYHLIKSI